MRGQDDCKGRTFIDFAVYLNRSVMHIDYRFHYGKTQTIAANRAGARRVDPIEPVEKVGDAILGDTNAGIGNLDNRMV